MNMPDQRTNYLDRFSIIDYAVQTSRLKALASRFQPVTASQKAMQWTDRSEQLVVRAARQAFKTTKRDQDSGNRAGWHSKQGSAIRILNDPVLVGELQAYEMEPAVRWHVESRMPRRHGDNWRWRGLVSTTPWLW